MLQPCISQYLPSEALFIKRAGEPQDGGEIQARASPRLFSKAGAAGMAFLAGLDYFVLALARFLARAGPRVGADVLRHLDRAVRPLAGVLLDPVDFRPSFVCATLTSKNGRCAATFC